MSIDLNWETLTTGPDGQELANRIRDFVHAKFQAVALPRFIKSVTVHDFEFGTVPPQLELKDITDPLPDFYEENPELDEQDDDELEDDGQDDLDEFELRDGAAARRRQRPGNEPGATLPGHINSGGALRGNSSAPGQPQVQPHDLTGPFLGVSTGGIPGGTSNLHYFHSQFASGSQTPLAAVAGAQHHLGNGWMDSAGQGYGHGSHLPSADLREAYVDVDGHAQGHSRNPSQSSVISVGDLSPGNASLLGGLAPTYSPPAGSTAPAGHHPSLREKHSVSTFAPTSAGTSRPPTRDTSGLASSAIDEDDDSGDAQQQESTSAPPGEGPQQQQQRRFRERRVEDLQAVFRIRYAGDVRLLLTADILLDYPMPSFVGIPVRLSITGLTFDGVGVVAHIRRRVHFCFLSPEDALAAVGGEDEVEDEDGGGGDGGTGRVAGQTRGGRRGRLGGLLQEIRVESEIGQREGGKQSLKNVGKVERFVLEQVRRIFEDEFVYPSFWTFLV